MARNVSDEELQLKKRARRRLVGAIVLVTAVAVVLPMILDSEPKPATQNINIQIPSPDAAVLSAKPAPLKPAEPEQPAVAATPEPASPASPPPAETKAAPKPVAKAEPKVESKPSAPVKAASKAESAAKGKDSAKEKAAAPAAGGFVIQVVALSDAAKAKDLQEKIAAAGLKAYTEVVQTAKGPVTRVRVGPYESREAAEKARGQLQPLQLDGKVIPR